MKVRRQGYEDTHKVCRKGDIHGRVTEGHFPEMKCVITGCKKDICMAKSQKDLCPFSYSGQVCQSCLYINAVKERASIGEQEREI